MHTWEKDTKFVYPTLNFDDEFIKLDKTFLNNSSLVCVDDIILYSRKLVKEQFKFIQTVLKNQIYGWILGPPGSGKSITAYSYIPSIVKDGWTVTWIHLSNLKYPICLQFNKNSKNSLNYFDINDVLLSFEDNEKNIIY